MFSFEGDYRRKPQQNLAGASKRGERTALLQHAQLERQKREQQRIKHNATVKIQAYVQSFLIRQSWKRWERCDFDRLQQLNGAKQLSLNELLPFIKKFLFFYNYESDGARLIWILQNILRLDKEIIQVMTNNFSQNKNQFSSKMNYTSASSESSNEWLWRMR